MFVFAFQIYWASQGYSWISKETSQCKELKSLTLAWVLTIFFWVFVIVGFVIGFFTMLFMAIDEGSCSCLNVCYGCIFCCTCGICNPKVSQQEQQRRQERRIQSQNNGSTALQFFGFGCGGNKKKSRFAQNTEMNVQMQANQHQYSNTNYPAENRGPGVYAPAGSNHGYTANNPTGFG